MKLIPPPGGSQAGVGPPVIMARAPLVTDDSSAGNFVGQHWLDTSVAPVQTYVCTDDSVGAADWQVVTSFDELATHIADLANPHAVTAAQAGIDNVGDIIATKVGAPDANDDSSNSWKIGDHIFDSTTGIIWAAEDVSVGAAVWNPINRILDGTVTNAKLADMNQRTFKGRDFGSNGPPQDLTRAEATALIEPFTDALPGTAPASGGGSTNFLRADELWAVPPASGPAGGDLGGNYPDPTVDDGADGSAIHDDVAGEITAITSKAVPIGADIIIIEDSAAADVKKSVAISDLPFAKIKTGTYTGDGTTSQAITGIGFLPKFVRIWLQKTVDLDNLRSFETTPDIIDDNASGIAVEHSTAGQQAATNAIIALGADGFTVDDDAADAHPNQSGQVYNYMAIG